ncbi:MAG TPA: DUF2510 domain-containing protein [Thermomonospora sp.]|nr:DUF2510 domain-containing protein [Thermomonospora sp.]
MSQPGWYADPHGTGRLRWWDGRRWTEHLHDPAAPARPERRQPSPAPLVAEVRGLRVYADTQGVSFADLSMAWAHVEWVAYWVARPGQWVFQVGRHPFPTGPRIDIVVEREDLWTRLADLSRRLLEPRLVADLAARVHAGEQVDVGHGLTVHPGGVRGGHVSLSWSALAGASIRDGRVWLHQTGASTPALYIPQQNPNAVLIPDLLRVVVEGRPPQ